MKKLVLLLMVLGLATGAYALTGIELSVNGAIDGAGNVTEIHDFLVCDFLEIDIHGPAALDWMGYIFIRDADATPGGAGGEWGDDIGPFLPLCSSYYFDGALEGYPGYPDIMDPNAGDTASVNRAEVPTFGYGYEVTAAQGEGDVPGGEQFRFLFHCCEEVDVYIDLWDAGDLTGPQDTILIHQIPEPATLVLLGLGGLFLRRRK